MTDQMPGADPYALPSFEEDDPDDPGPKRRGDTRLPFDVQVEIYAPECSVCGVTRDISLSGLFVETDAEIPMDTVCEVRLLATENSPKIVHKARVVRLLGPESGRLGIALVFADLSAE